MANNTQYHSIDTAITQFAYTTQNKFSITQIFGVYISLLHLTYKKVLNQINSI